jgi:YegS/Rv2252/BmrU family lipid kinase
VTRIACLAHAGSADWENLPGALGALRPRFGRVPVLPVAGPGEAGALAAELAAELEFLVIYGGDGTIHEIANGLARVEGELPVVVTLPGGTGNDLVRGLGLPVDPVAAAEAVVRGEPRPVDQLDCGGLIAANGVNAGFAAAATDVLARRVKTALGPAAYLVGGVVAAAKRPSWPVTVEVGGDGGGRFEGEAVAVVVGNGPSFGGGRRLLPDAIVDDGELDVTVVPAGASKSRLLAGLARGRMPEALPAFRGTTVRLATTMPCRLDGEAVATPSEVTVRPGAWRLLLPARDTA